MYLFFLFFITTAKDPISAPGDVSVEKMLNAHKISLPESSILSCSSGEISSVVSESLYTSYVTATTLSATTIIATDSDIFITGKLKISGSVSYTSNIQTSMDQHSVFLGKYSSFLEIPNNQWKELDIFKVFWDKVEADIVLDHKFLQIVGNIHCLDGDVMMKVDGMVEFLQNCHGTHHFRVVVKHTNKKALIEFFGTEKNDPILISFK